MDVNCLLKDELEFELETRGVYMKSTVAILKKVLKELLLTEEIGKNNYSVKAPRKSFENPEVELDHCQLKIEILTSYIADIQSKPEKSLFRRLFSRLCHLQNRVNFVVPKTDTDTQRKKTLMSRTDELRVQLEERSDIVERENLTLDEKKILEETLGEVGKQIIEKLDNTEIKNTELDISCHPKNVSNIIPEARSQSVTTNTELDVNCHPENTGHIIPERRSHSGFSRLARTSTVDYDITNKIQKRKLVPISQWGVKFSGTEAMSVNAFLERIEELRDARNATDEDLWRYAIDLFQEDALIWFRANKEYITNWRELVILLRRTFQRPYYQEELLDEIRRRTQGQNEPVTIYISFMQNMFNRLPNKVPESHKINIILKNLQPYYQRAVCRDVFTSVMDLDNVLRIVERTKVNCDNFDATTSHKQNLEPDLAYKPRNGNTCEIEEVRSGQEISNNAAGNRRCWNCREYGHLFRDCTLPKQRLFCFKCGMFGVTTNICKCTGNATGGVTNPAT